MSFNTVGAFRRTDALEAGICLLLNRGITIPLLRNFFPAVSRLGNGIIWYSILAALPILAGPKAIAEALHIGVTALIGVLIYKSCKRTLARERPFVTHKRITCVGIPLDRGSFPSGHTIHATCFTVMLGTLYPAALWALLPLAISIALSRVVLGHHYPSDVAAGALIGAGLAELSLYLLPVTMQAW